MYRLSHKDVYDFHHLLLHLSFWNFTTFFKKVLKTFCENYNPQIQCLYEQNRGQIINTVVVKIKYSTAFVIKKYVCLLQNLLMKEIFCLKLTKNSKLNPFKATMCQSLTINYLHALENKFCGIRSNSSTTN